MHEKYIYSKRIFELKLFVLRIFFRRVGAFLNLGTSKLIIDGKTGK
ncbi:hypothetical protein CLOLEP_00675 [[Clostridium] leptum DSM 753]|uniref:Uncharacterized protein n=1 Tax=[Clostridium] leptum DSM 753 TaxID=428125 RepID=A7VQ48_9FIRM|nr:hypothetical protein CLOLEP_00675 [[Clostridium] leptum DSM 753]